MTIVNMQESGIASLMSAELDDLWKRLNEKDKENQELANQLLIAKGVIRHLERQIEDARGNHAQIIEAFEAVTDNAEPGQCKALLQRIVTAHRKTLDES